ncbi:LOW QUALITY PROTEIN: cytochrome P450 [Aspergillus fumigatus Af293]
MTISIPIGVAISVVDMTVGISVRESTDMSIRVSVCGPVDMAIALLLFLRPLVYRLIPDVQRVYQHNARARQLVGSIVKQREKDEATIPGYTKPNDAIEWIWDLVPNEDKKNYGYQGIAQLAIAAVSVRRTSQLLTNIVLNLIAYPEYVPILKEEIENVLASCDGQWTLDSMSKLEKLDSFMKEVSEDTVADSDTATFQRKAVQRITLSDGTVLQPGTLALAPCNAIAFDPNIYPNPEQFDELRFYKLRHQNDSKANNIIYFTAASKTQVQFGGGRHACPGRWFAAHLIKMQAILFKYDLKFRTGEERPKTWLFQTINTPDPKGKILVRTAQHV